MDHLWLLEESLIAIIENYQNEEGFINIPKVLHKYMNGVVQIKN